MVDRSLSILRVVRALAFPPLLGLMVLGLIAASGCDSPPAKGPRAHSAAQGEGILDTLLVMLGDAEQINKQRVVLDPEPGQIERRAVVQTVFENPRTLNGVVDRLNQWLGDEKPSADWKPSPLLAELPEELRRRLDLEADLARWKFHGESDAPSYPHHDGWRLQEAFWLRDAANASAGDKIDPRTRAANLFAWTVREIQLETPETPVAGAGSPTWAETPLMPWQALLLGRGLAVHRAWVFLLLGRQQGLDLVMLGRADGADWLPALVDDGEFYLFDPQLGSPVFLADGQTQATLSLLQKTPDVPLEGGPLNATAQSAPKPAVVGLEGSPQYLAHRMHHLAASLPSNRRPVLASDPGAAVERIQKAAGEVSAVRLWEFPYRNLLAVEQSPPAVKEQLDRLLTPFVQQARLWNGRVRHIRGFYPGDHGALAYYLQTHLPGEGSKNTSEIVVRLARGHAEFWFGLVAQEQGDHEAAVKHFRRRLAEPDHGGPWRSSARSLLAQSYAALAVDSHASGRSADAQDWRRKALEFFTDPDSPSDPYTPSNQLRSARLEAAVPAK